TVTILTRAAAAPLLAACALFAGAGVLTLRYSAAAKAAVTFSSLLFDQQTTTPQTLPFTQDWSNTGLVTTDDNWSGVPGIIGYRGDDASAGTAVDPQTVTQDLSAVVDVNANRSDPNTFITGGISEFDGIANPVVALQGSG